ncbi:MAG: ATP-binding protein [Candidatus Lokiarchaeota archaeon]|nr:ATP-binding protein [Candidatus Lokiarchaeota archaeon]
MLIFENREQKLINTLKFIGSPFKKFVSTGEIQEDIGLVPSRQEFLDDIVKIIKHNENFVLPIIGEVGQGKTHLYWALKNILHNHNTVYISLETVYKKFYYRTYSEFIENMAVKFGDKIDSEDRIEPLRNMTQQLCNEWGANQRKFGFFQVADIDKTKEIAFETWKNKYKDNDALKDIITAIIAHQLEPYKKSEAERWLIGELMDVRDLSRLNLKQDLRKRTHAFTMLRVFIENSNKKSVLFLDDFERVLPIHESRYESDEQTEDIEEIFDPRWFGTKKVPEDYSKEKIFDKILELRKIRGLKIIISLKSIESFEELKKKIRGKNKKLLLMLKKPLNMSDFKEEDIFQFYKDNLEFFFANANFHEYAKFFSNSFFPLNESVLKNIFEEAQGNPREVIKLLIKIFNEIILSNYKLEEILDRYQ